MNIRNNIVNYLFDKDYIVCLYDDRVYFFNYKYLEYSDEKEMVVSLVDRKMVVEGSGMTIVKMTKEELLIRGSVTGVKVIMKDE